MTDHAKSALCDLSVVIVSYNTRDLTLKCVRSLLDCNEKLNMEVIVVDNSSADGSVEALRANFPAIAILNLSENLGFGAGNNRGFAVARGRYLLSLNPDTEVRPKTLKACIEHMDANPDVGMLGCMVRFENGEQQSTVFRYLSLRHILASCFLPDRFLRLTSMFGDHRYTRLPRNEIQDVDVVAGCFMLVHRELLKDIGGMDETLFMYGEEAEWCHRIRASGLKVRYFPFAEIMHHGGASTGKQSVWKIVETSKSQLIFLRRTRGAAVACVANLIMLSRDLLRMPVYIGLSFGGRSDAKEQVKLVAARLHYHARSILVLPGAAPPRIFRTGS